LRLYLDVETYRPLDAAPLTGERLIAVGVLEDWTAYKPESSSVWDGDRVRLRLFTEWGLGGEARLVRAFYRYLYNIVSGGSSGSIDFVCIVGFNILRYDIPLLTLKAVEYGVGDLAWASGVWSRAFIVDLFQVYLPGNCMRFKGHTLQSLARAAREAGVSVEEPHGSGADVRAWYESRRYWDIEEHLKWDLRASRILDLNYRRILGHMTSRGCP